MTSKHVWIRNKHEECEDRQSLDLLLDFLQHLHPGLLPAIGKRRGPPTIIDRENTQTGTFLANVIQIKSSYLLKK